MRILIISWRDIRNPQSGGAEVLTHEIAKRVAKHGHQITTISGRFPNAKKEEIVDNIKIVRPTNFSPINFQGYLRWPLFLKGIFSFCNQYKNEFDLVIDQIHGLPSFAPLYLKKPVILFPFEYADQIWNYEVPFPGNLIGSLLEKSYLKMFKNYPFIVISNSTAKELKKFGITNTHLITPGVNPPPKNIPQKETHPTFVSLGRLTPMKRLEETIDVFTLVSKKYPQTHLYIVGKGKDDYLNKIKVKASSLNLKEKILFTGFLSEKEKYESLAKSWALISTSVKEGFGLNVIEAASVATPTIAYKVPGIVDAVKNNQTGMLTNNNTPHALSEKIVNFIKNHRLRLKLGNHAKTYSQQFTWGKTTYQFLSIINQILKSYNLKS